MTYICHGDQSLHEETAICTNKGQWEPNSSNICVHYSGIHPLICLHVTIIIIIYNVGASLSRDRKIAVASSVTVFVVTSILCFTVGFLCRHWCPGKEAKRREVNVLENPSQGPLYDNVLPNQHNSEILELKENIAYGPINAVMES